MKIQTIFLFVALVVAQAITAHSQQAGEKIPVFDVKTLDGQQVSTTQFENEGIPYVLSFWATWCRPCLKELNAISDIYDEWLEAGFKVIAVSTDDARTKANILPMVNGRGWEYEFYHDENGDFRRAMGVNMVPHTFIIDGDGNIVYQHTSFAEGMEFEMLDKLNSLLNQ